MLHLSVKNAGVEKASANGGNELFLVYRGVYEEGDVIALTADEYPVFVRVHLEDALGDAVLYLTGALEYEVPFGEYTKRVSPQAFAGDVHYMHAAVLQEEEKHNYVDLMLNPYDQHDTETVFPHMTANAETRGEAVFYSLNVNNGIIANDSHGDWPYASWGIDGWKYAAITVHFGRPVDVDAVTVYFRADFPHDNWWEKIALEFSDGERRAYDMQKTGEGQKLVINKKGITEITMKELIMSDDPSPWPALSALKAWGKLA